MPEFAQSPANKGMSDFEPKRIQLSTLQKRRNVIRKRSIFQVHWFLFPVKTGCGSPWNNRMKGIKKN